MASTPRMVTAVVAFWVGTGSAAAGEWNQIRIGVDANYPPFEYTGPDGQIAGFSIDIANALCEELKAKCEFVNQDWEGIIPALLAKKIDAIVSSMSITEARKQQVDFTDTYYNAPAAVAVQKTSNLTGVSPRDLRGLSIGAQAATTHADYIQMRLPEARLHVYPSPDQYKLDLANGRLDAVMDSILTLDDWLKSEHGVCCKILALVPPDPLHGEGAGIAVRKEDQDLKASLNASLRILVANGAYAKINAKYFDFPISGQIPAP